MTVQKTPSLSGEKFIKTLSHLIHSVKIHQDNNQLIKDALAELRGSLAELAPDGDLTLQIWRGRFHIQGERVVYRRETFAIINTMLDYFSRRELGGLSFQAGAARVADEKLVRFIRLLSEADRHTDPPAWLELQLEKEGFAWVEILRKPDEDAQQHGEGDGSGPGTDDGQDQIHQLEKASTVYGQARGAVKELVDKSIIGSAGVRKARRLAQAIVDIVQEDNALLLGQVQNTRDDGYTHAVNVAALATCLGRYLGLGPLVLEHLAVSALLHDLGKQGDPQAKPFKESGGMDEWEALRQHPLISVKRVLKMNIPSDIRAGALAGAFEHHLNADLSGYPRTTFLKQMSLFGKILRIADAYETLTNRGDTHLRALTPDEALRRMWSERNKSYDPILLKCFINMLGLYPIGSIVELNNGALGLVMGYADETRKDRPLLTLLVDDGAGGLSPGETLDLAGTAATDDALPLQIVRSMHYKQVGIDPAHMFKEGLKASLGDGALSNAIPSGR